jgi:hypothetical protein
LPAANKLVLSRPDIVFNTVAGGTLRDSAAIAVTIVPEPPTPAQLLVG